MLADFASAESISEAALRVLDAPELQAQLESRARVYGQRLLWRQVGAQYRSLLREVLRQRPKPRPGLARPKTIIAPAPSALARGAAQ